MDSRSLAALLSSLVSQITLLIILLYPSSPHSHNSQNTPNPQTLISLLHHFLTSSELATIFTNPRKRTRTHLSEPKTHLETGATESKLGQLGPLVRVNSVMIKNPDSFRLLFKMAPSTFEWLSGLLEPLLECRDPVDSPLNLASELRLGIGLFRLTTGSSYGELADRFGITERVARFCCKQLCRVLCTNFRFWVGFPNSDEFDSVSKKFGTLSGLSNCCGVIGCTRFKIKGTKKHGHEEENIVAQIVVDSSCRILNIFVGSDHGDKSNLRVLKSSTLYKDIEVGSLLNSNSNSNPPPVLIERVGVPQYLVGDFEYPLLPWLMVPFDDPKPDSNEERFNDSVRLMRVSMQKTVASLKSWGILSKTIEEEEFRNGVAYIGACAILHNALLSREDYSGLCDRVEDCMIQDQSSNLQSRDSIQSKMDGSWIEGSIIRSALATKLKD